MSRTVLLVDDDPLFVEVVATVLQNRRGFAVLRAADGREAMAHIDRAGDQIDLILCDLNMPECDGIEVIEELHRLRSETPIILVTGAIRPVVKGAEVIARVHGLRVVETLLKPINLSNLTQAVDKALAVKAS